MTPCAPACPCVADDLFGTDATTVASRLVCDVARRPSCRRRPRRFLRLPKPPVRSLIPRTLESGQPLVGAEGNLSSAYRLAKRLFDMAAAACLLALFAPLMLVIFLVLLVTTRGKPFYGQRRVGYRGRIFRMFKFRTMRPEAEKIQHHVENELDGPIFKNRRDPRVTRFGRLLRKTSLDETPQLLNVLLGQMSLVGPRPLPSTRSPDSAPGSAAAWPSCRA